MLHKNTSSERINRPRGAPRPRSQVLHVPSSTASALAASLICQPLARRTARSRSASVSGAGKGSYPRNRRMAGMDSTGGSVCPFSQFSTVQGLTPSRRASCFWVSVSSSRRFLRCCPKVCGSKSVSFGFSALSRMGTNCKRATRPCKCGLLGHYSGKCRCTPDQVAQYRGRISGPLLDRIDMHIEIPAVSEAELFLTECGESSATVRERAVHAREFQTRRQGVPNSRLSGREIEDRAWLDSQGRQLLRDAIAQLQLSARAHHRVLKVARTIADLDCSQNVRVQHLAESLRYRSAA